jgi:UDP-glucose 4-epimerase
VLDCLKEGRDFRSPLAREIGTKGYHGESFTDGLYPVA